MSNSYFFSKNKIMQSKTRSAKFVINNRSIFVVFFQDNFYAYLNECKHLAVELDWEEANFFDNNQEFIVCSTHGALYDPVTGLCVSGPCKSKSLGRLELTEHEEEVEVFYDGN